MKFCIDCRWFLANEHTTQSNNLDYCTSPNAANKRVDMVLGNHRPAFAECERMSMREVACGPSAKLWEPLPTEFTPAEEASDVAF